MQENFAIIDDLRIHYLEHGPVNNNAAETIIFLHGFPESAYAWHHQLDYFGKDYRVISVDLLGYNDSDKPDDLADYQLPNLITLFKKFIQLVNQNNPVILVAHDWGGAIAWPLAAFHAELFSHLVILNAAHPSTFTREMINNPRQRAKSEYIHQLIAADANSKLGENDFAFLLAMLTDSKNQCVLSAEDVKAYRQRWSKPGVINGMLNYYRAMPQLAPSITQNYTSGPVTDLANMKIPNIRVNTKTLVLWGEKDNAFVAELLDGIEEYVPDIQIVRFAQASHWIQHEVPSEVNSAIECFLGGTKNSLK